MSYVSTGAFKPLPDRVLVKRQQEAVGFTEEQEATLLANQAEILKRQKDEESRRRWTILLTAGGALFAALRLGIIALPLVKKRRVGKLGA